MKPVWTLGKEKLFIAGNTSEIKIIGKQKQEAPAKHNTPKKERNVKNEKTSNFGIMNQQIQDPLHLTQYFKTPGTLHGIIENNDINSITQVQDLCVCLRNRISSTTDLASNPFLSNSSRLPSIFSPAKKQEESTDDIEAKMEITFSFTIIGWKDTVTGIGKKYEKKIDENIDTTNVEVEVENENEEKKSARKSFSRNFKTVTKRNSTAKKITRMSITPHKTDFKIKNNDEVNISNITTIEIHGVNVETKMGILLEYKMYSALMPYLISDWLVPGKEIKVSYGLVTEIDKNNDIIRIQRSEHTIVNEKCGDICDDNLYSATEKNDKKLSTTNNAVRNNSKNKDNKRNDKNKENDNVRKDHFNVNNSDNMNDNDDNNEKKNINKKILNYKNTDKYYDDDNVHNTTTMLQRAFRSNTLENERNRYDALCQNKTDFQNIPNDCFESCFRHRINNAYVRVNTARKIPHSGNIDENSSTKIVENSEISGSSGIVGFDVEKVSVEDCTEDPVAVMMTFASDEALHAPEQQQQQQQQQQQYVVQSVIQGGSKDSLTDRGILDDQNTSPESTESNRANRQGTVSLTVSKDNRSEIMLIEYSLLPTELQSDFHSKRNPAYIPTTKWNDRKYDIVFTRTCTSKSGLNVGTVIPPPPAHSREGCPAEDSLYRINRDSVISTTSSRKEKNSDHLENALWKIIWMRQK